MSFLKADLLRSFGIGFLVGCAALFMTMDSGEPSNGVVPSAIAAPAR
ncbi:hypothetical protein [Novosphingobium sp. TH158]|nr:hypothetical protein [Novosphingobium sp. TH158]